MQRPGTGRELKVLLHPEPPEEKAAKGSTQKNKKSSPGLEKKVQSSPATVLGSAKEDAFPVRPVDWLLCLLAKLETTAYWTDVRIV